MTKLDEERTRLKYMLDSFTVLKGIFDSGSEDCNICEKKNECDREPMVRYDCQSYKDRFILGLLWLSLPGKFESEELGDECKTEGETV